MNRWAVSTQCCSTLAACLLLPDPTVLLPLLTHLRRRRRRRGPPPGPLRRRWPASRGNGSHEARLERLQPSPTSSRSASTPSSSSTPPTVLDHTRSAHLWRWPIPETVVGADGAGRGRRADGCRLERQRSDRGGAAAIGRVPGGRGPGVAMRVVVDSHVVGVAKPDPRIFELRAAALRRVRTGNASLYVGDSVTMDIASARGGGPPSRAGRPVRRPRRRRLRADPLGDRARRLVLMLRLRLERCDQPAVRRRAITLRHSVSSAPSKIDSTRASTNRRLTEYSSA